MVTAGPCMHECNDVAGVVGSNPKTRAIKARLSRHIAREQKHIRQSPRAVALDDVRRKGRDPKLPAEP